MKVTITLSDKEIIFYRGLSQNLITIRINKFRLKMLVMSVYEWLLTKNQRKAYSYMKFLSI